MANPRKKYSRDNYWRALGKFVDQFASIETGMHLLLQERTRMPLETARAVFSGVRVKDAMSFLGRLSKVFPLKPETLTDQEFIFAQLRTITDIRNLILHYGTSFWIGPGEWIVSDWLTALTDDQIRDIRVSSKLLLDLTHDLRKIQVHLAERHLWREPGLMSPYSKRDLALLKTAWRYTPPAQGLRRQKTRDTTPKRSHPRRPSRT